MLYRLTLWLSLTRFCLQAHSIISARVELTKYLTINMTEIALFVWQIVENNMEDLYQENYMNKFEW
jgi:hypothetical protein